MNFEWDETKRLINLAKHGVDFVRALRIFNDSTLEILDQRQNYGEVRIIATGTVENEVFVVVYTWRGKNRRLISARKAGNNARKKYYASYPQTGAQNEG
jgi:uncharacterized protein